GLTCRGRAVTPDIVVDVGNSRIKWGRVADGTVAAAATLPPDDRAAWDRQLVEWELAGPLRWVAAGVNPPRQNEFLDWVRARGDTAQVLERAAQLPLTVKVPEPDKVGIDRLLGAVAANVRRFSGPGYSPERGAIVVGVGTAVTVDLLDDTGAF